LVTRIADARAPLMRVNDRRSSVSPVTSAMSRQVDRHAVARQHHRVLDLLDVGELAGAAEQQRSVRVVHLAERDVLVLGAQDLHDPIGREVESRDLLAGEIHADLPAQAAVDGDGRDARDALEAG
jgi:hypothetical protein